MSIELTPGKDHIANEVWERVTTWDVVLPPSRPSTSQLRYISRAVRLATEKMGQVPVAVLGSTPEFRDLLFELGFSNVAVLDRSPACYRAMTRFRTYSSSENFILGDWRDSLRELPRTFGVILSDLTSGNIPYNDRRTFYSHVTSALVNQGVFIDRILMHRKRDLWDIDRVARKFQNAATNLIECNRFNCAAFFRSSLLGDEVVDSTRFYEYLGRRFNQGRLTHFLEQNKSITPPGGKWWYGRDWSELAADYCTKLDAIGNLPEPRGSVYSGIGSLVVARRPQ